MKKQRWVWLAVVLFAFCLIGRAAEKTKKAGAGMGTDPHRLLMASARQREEDFRNKEMKKSEPITRIPYAGTAAATILTIDGAPVAGEIEPAGNVDAYEFTVSTLGYYGVQTLAGPLGSSMDTVVDLYGPNDPNILIGSNDDGGLSWLSFYGAQLAPGSYYVNVRGYSSTSSTGEYSVQVVTAGLISGKVTDPSSVGINDLEVDLYAAVDDDFLTYTYTDANGDYSFIRAAGGFKLRFYPYSDDPYAWEWYNNKSSYDTADTVTVTAGSATTANAQLAAAGFIAGRVTNSGGIGIPKISAESFDTNGNYLGYNYTNSNGDYTLSNLPTGSYKVGFFDYNNPGFDSEYYNNQTDIDMANPVAVTGGSTTSNINAELSGCRGSEHDDLVATWTSQGVYSRSSETGKFYKMATPATVIATAELDGDCIDDLVGIWPSQAGVWVKYSSTGAWAKLASTARHITTGDMDGDGDKELVGTWDGQGVYYLDGATWVKMATPATLIHAGDLNHDYTDDLIGIWPSQGGVWVKYSGSGTWARLSTTAQDITSGDVNHSGWVPEFIGTWDGQGVYYLEYDSGTWTKMATPATLITCGDLDGDWGEHDDLVGVWPGQGGVWVKYNESGTWQKLSSTATDIVVGKMREWGSTLDLSETLAAPNDGSESGPDAETYYQDLTASGPGGVNFAPKEMGNLEPTDGQCVRPRRPGPGEPGFCYQEEENLEPQPRDKSAGDPERMEK